MTDNFTYLVFTCFECSDFDKFVETVKEILDDELSNGKAVLNEDEVDIMGYADPDSYGLPRKFSCWQSAIYPDKIFFMSNSVDGSDSLCYVINGRLGGAQYTFSMSTFIGTYLYNDFLYSYDGERKRVVKSYLDDTRWVFYEKGEPLFFEDVNNYKARMKKKRLNKEILLDYMSKYGINFYDIDSNIVRRLNYIQDRW